jgi:hypothetical protein
VQLFKSPFFSFLYRLEHKVCWFEILQIRRICHWLYLEVFPEVFDTSYCYFWILKKPKLHIAQATFWVSVFHICYLVSFNLSADIQFGSRMHMLPLPKKHILECQKNWPNFLHLNIHNLSAFVKFHRKSILFCLYKKDKIIMW